MGKNNGTGSKVTKEILRKKERVHGCTLAQRNNSSKA
jgi:hypothetical protein